MRQVKAKALRKLTITRKEYRGLKRAYRALPRPQRRKFGF